MCPRHVRAATPSIHEPKSPIDAPRPLSTRGAVVRVVLKTAPLEQWTVARTMRERIKAAFDEAGIRIPSSILATAPEPE